jgi:alkyl sulfatase BDS1-like metallo-beta-lactamase superfamily hydrolase
LGWWDGEHTTTPQLIIISVKNKREYYSISCTGNPATFDPLPPVEDARRWVELVGSDKMLSSAQSAYDQGDYRWTVQLCNKLVFADPTNTQAKTLEANALKQLAYQTESSALRNYYLTGALELCEGVMKPALNRSVEGVVTHMPVEKFFDLFAVHIDGPRAQNAHLLYCQKSWW